MKRLTEILSPKDQAKVKQWAIDAKNPKYEQDIPPELYVAAQLGLYYGWQAVEAYRRGYYTGIDDHGTPVRYAFEFADAIALVRAAEKARYRQIVDESKIREREAILSRGKEGAKRCVNDATKIVREKAV